MRNEVYKKKLDKEGNPILKDGDFVTELVSTEGEDDKLTINQLNEMQYNELKSTDWYFVRKVELDVEVPNEVIEYRLAIRKKYDDLKKDL